MIDQRRESLVTYSDTYVMIPLGFSYLHQHRIKYGKEFGALGVFLGQMLVHLCRIQGIVAPPLIPSHNHSSPIYPQYIPSPTNQVLSCCCQCGCGQGSKICRFCQHLFRQWSWAFAHSIPSAVSNQNPSREQLQGHYFSFDLEVWVHHFGMFNSASLFGEYTWASFN